MVEKRQVPCDLCGSNEQEFLFDAKDRLHGCEGAFTYVQCRECGLVFMNPQVVPGEIGGFYPSDYSPHKAKVKTEQLNQSVIRRKLKKRPFASSLFKRVSEKSRILDVGCGSGIFLYEMKTTTGCDVYGIDISKTAAKTARESYGIEVFNGKITQSPFEDNFFDVITAWAFLEHVNSPSEILLKMSNLLKKDGFCIISIPNFESINARLFKDKWYHLDCPRHLYIFTKRTIIGLFEKSNLRIKKIAYNKSTNGVLNSLQYYFYGDNYNPNHRDKVKRSLLLRKIAPLWSRITALMRQSDMMSVFAEKAEG